MIAVEVWGDPSGVAARPPDPGRSGDAGGGWRAIRVEPTVWWLSGPLADVERRLLEVSAALAIEGAATDLTGAFVRVRIAGSGWRERLMTGGVFDAEGAGFGADSTAGTLLHHVSVRYDVVDDDAVDVYVAPSYLDDLLHHLRRTTGT